MIRNVQIQSFFGMETNLIVDHTTVTHETCMIERTLESTTLCVSSYVIELVHVDRVFSVRHELVPVTS